MKKVTLAASVLTVLLAGMALAKEVPINPITPEIRDKIKESSDLVARVEDSMAPKVMELEKIYKTYNDTCKGKEGDRGCAEIQNQVRERYKEVLTVLGKDLPRVRNTVSATTQELGKSIKKKVQGKDLRELYDNVAEKGTMPKIRGPLSKKLSELLKAMGRPSSNLSVLELSLQTQADLISASEMLEFLEAEISRQIVVVDMIKDFGMLSPEMASVMKGVAEIFGYNMDFVPEAVPEKDSSSDDWRK